MLRIGFVMLVATAVACSDDTTPPVDDTGGNTPDSGLIDGFTSETSPQPDGTSDLPPPSDASVDDTGIRDGSVPDSPTMPDKGSVPDTVVSFDLGPNGCISNSDCISMLHYCHMPVGCQPPGICQVKPLNCTFIYDPVCGCDGKNYSNPCFANAGGTSVKHKGNCTTSTNCAKIRADYSAALNGAKTCFPMLPVVQCVTVVTKDLACGCSTAVNKNSMDYAKLISLQTQWKAQGCASQPWNCPAMPCPSVSTGQCDAATGKCVDLP